MLSRRAASRIPRQTRTTSGADTRPQHDTAVAENSFTSAGTLAQATRMTAGAFARGSAGENLIPSFDIANVFSAPLAPFATTL